MKKFFLSNKFIFSPVIFLTIIWTCIAHMDVVPTGLQDKSWFPNIVEQADFFLHIRSICLIILAIWMIFIMLIQKTVRKTIYLPARCFLLFAAYAILIIVSTLFSVNPDFSLWGSFESHESIWSLLSYLVLFLYFFNIIKWGYSLWNFIRLLLIGAFLQGCIGLSQLFGHDFWVSNIGRRILLLGTGVVQGMDRINSIGYKNKVYMTFYHPNYAAVYLILIIPIAVFTIFYLNSFWKKVMASILSIILCTCLWGTGSKAGLITLTTIIIIAITICFSRSKKRKCLLLLTVFFLSYIAISFISPKDFTVEKIINNIHPADEPYEIENIYLKDNVIEVCLKTYNLYFQLKTVNGKIYPFVTNEFGHLYKLKYNAAEKAYYFDDTNCFDLILHIYSNSDTNILVIVSGNIPWIFMQNTSSGKFQYVTLYNKVDSLITAPSINTYGLERALSGRIYLWSRTLPLLKHFLFIGSGPDTYVLTFPQNDYIARAKTGLFMLVQIITKPHSFYLQAAIQTGVLSCIALIVCFLFFMRKALQNIQKLFKAGLQSIAIKREFLQKASLLLSLIGFWIMGITNDSMIVTSPIFWMIFGISWSIFEL